MEAHLAEIETHCLHCEGSRGENLVPRPLRDINGVKLGEVLQSDYFGIGACDNIKIGRLVDGGHHNFSILLDHLSRYTWFEPAEACSGEVAARTILKPCRLFRVPRVFVRDGAPYYRDKFLPAMAERLEVVYRFAVAHSGRTNRTVKSMNREVVISSRAILNERRRPVREYS